ncbi:unnamed protein product [Symbiodinium natans]|uniref:Uncharacterized protein n=1 Tax=Symbiodinium natans TaxID=878477 RepID=A0A812HX11_9DINO|nr:unnamed protein product [Symbiodinium natans]
MASYVTVSEATTLFVMSTSTTIAFLVEGPEGIFLGRGKLLLKAKCPKLQIGSHTASLALSFAGPAVAQSTQGYVWAAPLKLQVPVQPACAPTYARGWQPVPVRVTRRTFRVVGSPVPGPFMMTRRTLGVVVKPARVVVSAAAPTHLPHLLGSAKASALSCPVKGPPKAGVEPAETSECERKEAAIPEEAIPEASAPASEMVHPKGRPVSYGPASPFLKIEEGADDADNDEPKAAPKPAPNPAPEPAELTQPPQEAPEELPGQAEALEALKALMAELGGMGFKVPKKPTGEPEVGDLVVLSDTIKPESLRLRYAVIMKVHEKHYTARTLAEDKATLLEECWPNMDDAVLESTVGRLGSRVRVIEGPNAGCTGKVAKAPGHPMFPTFRQFRNGEVQYIINVTLDGGRDALFLLTELRQIEQ